MFVMRFWRGEYSLGVSYWLFGFGITLAAYLFVALVAEAIPDIYSPLAIFAAIVITWVGVAALGVWQAVGVWRSATRHAGRRTAAGRSAFWARAAQTMVVIGIVRLCLLIANSGVPQITEATKMAFRGDPTIPDYTVTLAEEGRAVVISGGFKYGLGRDLDALTRMSPGLVRVFLDSPGGRMGEAERVAGIIRGRGLDTVVINVCASACVIAFAAGRERLIGPYGRIGLHSPEFPGVQPEDLTTMQADFARQLIDSGFDPAFVRRGVTVPNDQMWFPTRDELVAANAVTGDYRGGVYVPGGPGDPEAIRKELLESPVLRAMQAALPAEFEAMVARLGQAARDGLDAEALRGIVAEDVAASRRRHAALLTQAPDEDIATILQMLTELHRAALAKGGRPLCNRLAIEGTSAIVDSGPEFTAIIARNGGAMFDAIGHAMAAPVGREPVRDADYDILIDAMVAAGTTDEQITALGEADPSDPDFCLTLIAMMEAAADMPGEAGARVRASFVSDVAAE